MGAYYEYEYEIEATLLSDELSEEELDAMLKRLQAATPELGSFSRWRGSFTCRGEVSIKETPDDFAYEQTKIIFRALGHRAEAEWSWWHMQRDPDEWHSFTEDDYDELIGPLEQLAGTAEDK